MIADSNLRDTRSTNSSLYYELPNALITWRALDANAGVLRYTVRTNNNNEYVCVRDVSLA